MKNYRWLLSTRLQFALLMCAMLLVLANGCARRSRAKELVLYCGAGIRPACEALIESFAELDPDIKISVIYDGSGKLLGRVSSIDRGDLFMPGSSFYVEKATEKNLVDASTKKIVGYFIPVVFVGKGNPKNVRSLNDLIQDDLRIGLGDERSCAIGKTALKLFEKNGIDYEDLKEQIVLKSGTVLELPLAVKLGNVDAVIVWDVNARAFKGDGEIVEIPIDRNEHSEIPIVVLNSSQHREEALKFIEYVSSESGKRIVAGQGYSVSLGTEPGGGK